MLDRVAVVTGCLTRLSVFLEMIEAVAVVMGIDTNFLVAEKFIGDLMGYLVAGSE